MNLPHFPFFTLLFFSSGLWLYADPRPTASIPSSIDGELTARVFQERSSVRNLTAPAIPRNINNDIPANVIPEQGYYTDNETLAQLSVTYRELMTNAILQSTSASSRLAGYIDPAYAEGEFPETADITELALRNRFEPITEPELDAMDLSELKQIADKRLAMMSLYAGFAPGVSNGIRVFDAQNVTAGTPEDAIEAAVTQAADGALSGPANSSNIRWFAGQGKSSAPYEARADATYVAPRWKPEALNLGFYGRIQVLARIGEIPGDYNSVPSEYMLGPIMTGNYQTLYGLINCTFPATGAGGGPNQGSHGGKASDILTLVNLFPQYEPESDGDDEDNDCCPGEPCTSGKADGATESAHFNFGLGSTQFGWKQGSLELYRRSPSLDWYQPAVLQLKGQFGFTAIRDSDNNDLLQVTGPELLVDVNVISSQSYELNYYHWDGSGTPDANGEYPVPGGSPHTVFLVENPDTTGDTFNELSITRTFGTDVDVWTYSYDEANDTWTYSSDNGNTVETLTHPTAADPDVRIDERTITDANGVVLSKVQEHFKRFPWGEEQIMEVHDPDGVALTRTWDYYDDEVSDGNNYRYQKSSIDEHGFWEVYTYDQFGRLLQTKAQFKNAAFDAPAAQCRVTDYLYPSAQGTDYYTTTVTLLGQEISRVYRRVTIEGYDEYTCTSSGAAITDASNLLMQHRVYVGSEYTGMLKSIRHHDGTMEIYSYSALDAQGNDDIEYGETLTTTIDRGEPNASGTAIIDGTRTTTLVDRRGNTLAETVEDIASGLTIEQRLTTSQDAFGRQLVVQLLDGRTETSVYGCCGLESFTDALGITTTFSEVEGVSESSTRLGITTTTRREGRVLITERDDNAGSLIEISRETFDIAGRLVSSETTGNRITTLAHSYDGSGNRVVTSTLPNAAVQVETFYPEGLLKSSTGSATFGRSLDYGIDSGQYFIETTQLDGSNTPTSETAKTFYDHAARAWKIVRGDGATWTSYFNNDGQLARLVDPDGVTTLHEYDGRGRRTITALDADGDDAVSLGGTDLIVRSTQTVTNGAGAYPVVRTIGEVWQTDGSATPTEVSRLDAEVTGSASWLTTPAGSSQRSLAYAGSGDWTATSNLADGGVLVEQFVNGRPQSSELSDGLGTILSGSSYTYDTHGRLSSSTDLRNGTTSYTFYDTDEIASVTTPDPGDGRPAQTIGFQYTSLGQQDIVTQPDGGTVDYDYFPNGLLQSVSGSRTYAQTYTYTAQGRRETLTTNAGTGEAQTTTWTYHPFSGKNTGKTYADGSGYSLTHTPGGRLQTRTNGRGTVTTYGYDSIGRLDSQDYSDATLDLLYTYYRNGDLKTLTRGATVRTFAYGAPNVLETESVVGGLHDGLLADPAYDNLLRRTGLSVSFEGDTITQSRGYQPGTSRLAFVAEGDRQATYTYHDHSSLLRSATFTQAGTQRLVEGRDFNKHEQLISIGSYSTGATLPVQRSYGLNRNLIDQVTGIDREDDRDWAFGYDALGHLSSAARHQADGSPVAGEQFGYQYDSLGNRTASTFGGDSSGGNLHSHGYTAAGGDRNQYQSVTTPGVAVTTGKANASATVQVNGTAPDDRQGAYFAHNATVDNSTGAALASLLITADENGQTDSYTAKKLVRKASASYQYDNDGNLTSDDYFTYTWDAENRLLSVETLPGANPTGVAEIRVTYEYDFLSRRIGRQAYQKVAGNWTLQEGQVFVYDGWNIVGQWDDAGTLEQSYLWGVDMSHTAGGAGGAGGLVSVAVHSGASVGSHFVSNDGSGNVVALTDTSTGDASALYEYDPFGNVLFSAGSMAAENPFRFGSQWVDDYTSQVLYVFRAYDPVNGRWLSRDPLGEAGGLNLYAHCIQYGADCLDVLGLVDIDSVSNEQGESVFFIRDNKSDSQPKVLVYPPNHPNGVIFDPNSAEWYEASDEFINALSTPQPQQLNDRQPQSHQEYYDAWESGTLNGTHNPLDPGVEHPFQRNLDSNQAVAATVLNAVEGSVFALTPDPAGEIVLAGIAYRIVKLRYGDNGAEFALEAFEECPDGDELFEIGEGVRRSKAAEILGHEEITVRIIQEGQDDVIRQVPLTALRSPKESIDASTLEQAERFADTLEKTRKAPVGPENAVQVRPGSRGTPIKDVNIVYPGAP